MKINEVLLKQKKQNIHDEMKNWLFYITACFLFSLFLIFFSLTFKGTTINIYTALLLPVAIAILVGVKYCIDAKKHLSKINDNEFLKENEKFNIDQKVAYKNGFVFNELIKDTFLIKKFDETSNYVLLENVFHKELKQVSLNELVNNYT